MKIILEMKGFCKDISGKLNEYDMFYKYNIDGNLILFTQNQKNGNIYTAHVRLKEYLNEHFNVWIHCEDNRLFYPDDITIEIHHSCIKQAEVGKIVADIKYINKLCDKIMSIFKSSEHYDLWVEHIKLDA